MHDVIIQRSRWGFGGEGGTLLTGAGKMCCLGFICEQAGMTPDGMLLKPFPSCSHEFTWTRESTPSVLRPLVNYYDDGTPYDSSALADELARINDADFIYDREQRLRDRAAEGGYNFIFVD